ncbi:hypothetical protein LXL04_013845 [Taraxacum kok-saghyz]
MHGSIISYLGDESYKANPNDVLLCSYPKSGTTWLKALAYAIVTREKFDASSSPLLTTLPHDCVPCLEFDPKTSFDLPIIAAHLPYTCLPESFIASNCKIVYIYRNTKDVIVSYYHYAREMVKLNVEDAPFEGAFDEFCQGISFYGPYWDHILGYWKSSQENPDRLLFLKYEDMKVDATSNVKRLAEFIGHPFSIEEEKAGVVENIIKLCSFKNLSNLQVTKAEHTMKTNISL